MTRLIRTVLPALLATAIFPLASAQTQPTPLASSAELQSSSITGTIIKPSGGKTAEGLAVTLVESGQATRTDKYGQYGFSNVKPGTYTILATGEGYSRLRITDVVVQPNHTVTLSAQEMPIIFRDGEVQMMEEVIVSAKRDVETLEKYIVAEQRPEAFSDANVDLPRTIDDAQPYYIFDSKTIDQSGAISVDDFLKRRLSMNTIATSPAQQTGGVGNGEASDITLRGLPQTQTLVLVDGRRLPGYEVTAAGGTQGDLNGIPLDAIDRIEVLPDSASAIYGGGAVGGVINVVLKRNYTGGDIKYTYENTMVSDAPVRTLDATYGSALEDGKSHLMISAHYSDEKPLLFEDRPFTIDRAEVYFQREIVASPTSSPIVGLTTNIVASPSSGTLVLKNGVSLGSNKTYVPAGTSPTTSATTLGAGLVADAGNYNYAAPPTSQYQGGTLNSFGTDSRIKSITANFRREMTKNLEVFVDFYNSSNIGIEANWDPYAVAEYSIPSTVAINPFQQNVLVYVPVPQLYNYSWNNPNDTKQLTEGFTLKLPRNWKVEGDYSWSTIKAGEVYPPSADTTALGLAFANGTLNPFTDTLAYPWPNASQYVNYSSTFGRTTLNDLAVRSTGDLWRLPGGMMTLAVGAEHRKEGTPDEVASLSIDPLTPASDSASFYFGRSQSINSVDTELEIPVVSAANHVPGIYQLDLQLAGRREVDGVATGTASVTASGANFPTNYNLAITGGVLHGHASYGHNDPTYAMKYEPVKGVMLRASYGTAFLPPTYAQLAPGVTSTTFTTVTDPLRGNTSASVLTITGGNPDLKPQNSNDTAVGLVLEPAFLKGFRLDIEWYRIREHSVIGTLTAQVTVNDQSEFPNRVIRGPVPAGDPYGVGPITEVNDTSLNLSELISQGMDFTADYRMETKGWGSFDFNATATQMQHYDRQTTINAPLQDLASWVTEGGPIRWKANGTLSWQYGRWNASWTAEYYDLFRMSGAPGDPTGSIVQTTIIEQGSSEIPPEMYHTVTLGYRFPSAGSHSTGTIHPSSQFLSGVDITVGVKNVFNHIPPYDAAFAEDFYTPFGDIRLRDYWISVRKQF